MFFGDSRKEKILILRETGSVQSGRDLGSKQRYKLAGP